MNNFTIAILDCGSQTCQLIARRCRDLGFFAKIFTPSISLNELQNQNVKAIIISGGPSFINLHSQSPLEVDAAIFQSNIPIMGICYGMQLIMSFFNGKVAHKEAPEFGQTTIYCDEHDLFATLPKENIVWMSHSDHVEDLANDFNTIAKSSRCQNAAVSHKYLPIIGLQFHPEISHTKYGNQILQNFLTNIARLKPNYSHDKIAEKIIEKIKSEVGNEKVLLGLSGGVDSCVAAMLMQKAIGDNLHSFYINNGLHREGEIEEIKKLPFKTNIIDAEDMFLHALKCITDAEQKRKTIGKVFADIFKLESKKINATYLAQGTLYPDVIESESTHNGKHFTIKTHHNVGGLPKELGLKVLEPLREFFKDEVRKIGKEIGLSEKLLHRQPFPGPGLAVRISGEVTKEKILLLRKADKIVREEICKQINLNNMPNDLWQYFAILLPCLSVGVKGDSRKEGFPIVIRCVNSTDAMSADWTRIDYDVLSSISTRITSEIEEVTRVLYDITQKPPGTIEWE